MRLPDTLRIKDGVTWLVAAYAVWTALLLWPIFAVRVPCLGDYLNHLARISIMKDIGGSLVLQRYYQTSWKFVPYYGMDIPVLLLTRMMSVYAAGRIFVAACVLMPVAAAAALRWAAYRRIGYLPLLAGLFSFNHLLERGYVNYLFSAGLSVLLFAGWIATEGRRPFRRAALFSAGLMALYMCHAFALLVYCILVFGYEMGRAWRAHFRPAREIAACWLAAALQAVPVLVIGSVLGGNSEVHGSYTYYGTILDKIGALISPLYFPSGFAGGDTIIVGCILFLVACALVLWRELRFAPVLTGPVLALLIASVAMPSVLFNAWGCDFRIPLIVVIVLIAGLAAPGSSRGRMAAVLACTLAFVALRSAGALAVLTTFNRQIAEVRRTLAPLPDGAKLLVVDTGQADAKWRALPATATGHVPLIAAIDHHAFVPYLFIGTLPLAPVAAMVNSSSSISVPIDLAQLQDGFTHGDPPGGPPRYGWGGHMYWLGWPGKFDYVLLEHFGAAVGHLPPALRVVEHGIIADLYAVDASQ
jgi:hypothetical protein